MVILKTLTPIPKGKRDLLISLARDFSQVASASEQNYVQDKSAYRGFSVIGAFNDLHHPSEFLERNNYKLVKQGSCFDVYLAPDSTSGNAGVRLFHNDGKPVVFTHHSNDVLSESQSERKGHDAFSCFQVLEHNNNFNQALDIAKKEQGINTENPPSNQSNSQMASEAEIWPERKDLPEVMSKVPTLEPDLIPTPLRAWVEDEAARLCVPLEFIIVPAIAFAGGLIGRTLGVHPKQKDDWLEVPNLWCAIAGNPSSRKTQSLKKASCFVKALAEKAMSDFAAAKVEREVQVKLLKACVKGLESKAKSNKYDSEVIAEELLEALTELEGIENASPKRYLVDDATIEKIVDLVVSNPRGLTVMQDEVIRLLKSFSKQGREQDRGFYLQAYNGTGSYTVDRISRGTQHIPALTISIVGGIQPDRLQQYLVGTLSGENDGFMQRFQLFVWPDKGRQWKLVDTEPNEEARVRAEKIFFFLDELDPVIFGFDSCDQLPSDKIFALHFDDSAQKLFYDWLNLLMQRVESEELSNKPAFQAHLGKYPKLCASLALIFHLIQVADENQETEPSSLIGAEATQLAIQWCEFLEQHAAKLYAIEINNEAYTAKLLAGKISEGKVKDGQATREIYRHHWAGLDTPELVNKALSVLESINWVKLDIKEGNQGRPSEIIRLHPDFKSNS